MRAEVVARARLVACALAGAAIVLYISSVKDDESAELYQHQKNVPATMFTINAERIAHGLEEKNRINAEKVIVSYTREDKILAGFQKAVKERDAKFRNEVAQAAKESEAEEAATHHFDNNGDPDDPKFKYEIVHSVTPKQEIKSKFEQVSEQKSEKVESHIDHEVAEITGENQISPAKNAINLKPKSIQDLPAENKPSVLSPDVKSKDEKSRPIRTAEHLEKYMKSPAYHEARAAAKKKAEAAENEMDSRLANDESKKDTPAAKISEASQNLNKASSLETIKSKLSHDQDVLPEDLEKYSEHAPIDLKDYMKSPEYLKIRNSAERASERYYEERARRLEQKKMLMTNAPAKPEGEGTDTQSTVPTPSSTQATEKQIKTDENIKKFTGLDHNKNGEEHFAKASTLAGSQAPRQVSRPSLADDDDSDEPEDAPKDEPEEPSEPDDPTEDVPSGNVPEGEGLGEENQIRKTRKFTKELHGGRVVQVKEGPNTPTTNQLADSHTAHESTVGDQRTKESKLQLLRHFMESNEFKRQESEARSESAPKGK